ncbi:MAG TPA: transglycosylase family protein [Patescibacteria group bacterium]|nr:transglycosylase family protein [Patescibacteria group bacterium]
MENTNNSVLDRMLAMGERLPFFLLLLIAGFFLFRENSQQVLSAKTTSLKPVDEKIVIPTYPPTPTPTETPTPTDTPTPTCTPTPTVDPTNDAIWDSIAYCETHDNWGDDTGNGYYGGLQFSQTAWNSVGGSGNPAQASRTEQIARGKLLQNQRGWGPWNVCAKKLGLD